MTDGTAAQTQGYYPWGETRFGSLETEYQFTGQYRQPVLGLDYFNARWYDSSLGRFAQADSIVPGVGEGENPTAVSYLHTPTYTPLVVDFHETQLLEQVNSENKIKLQDPNFKLPPAPTNSIAFDRYAYSLNNPVRYTDPTGHCPFCIALAAITITPIGWVAIGVATAAVVVYYAVPGVSEAVTNGMYEAGEAASNGLNALFTKKDWIPPGMTREEKALWGEAAELYKEGLDLPKGFQLPKTLAQKLAELIKQGFSPEEAADALDELEDIMNEDK